MARAAALSSLRPAHLALALLVVAIWGTNFVVIKVGLRDFPPFLFALLRFVFSVVPFIFFVRRPDVAWRWLLAYGVLLGAGQFGLLYFAMRADISPGLASLVIQMQVPFTIVLSVILFHEKIGRVAVVGTLLRSRLASTPQCRRPCRVRRCPMRFRRPPGRYDHARKRQQRRPAGQ